MRRLFMAIAIAGLLTMSALAQVTDVSPEQKQAQQIQQRIAELYVSDFRNEVQLTDDQFLKLGPNIRQFIMNRFKNAERRRDLTQQREQLLGQPNPSDADVQKLNEDTAQFERQSAMAEANFLGRIRSELTPRQQLLIPQFNRKFFDERLPDLLRRARELAGPPRGQKDPGAAQQQQPSQQQSSQQQLQQQPKPAAQRQNQTRGNGQGRAGNALRDKIQQGR